MFTEITADEKGSDPLVSAFGFLFSELFFFCLRINLMYWGTDNSSPLASSQNS